jgi:hypothetical protein
MTVTVEVAWDDGAPTSRETFAVAASGRWARNLIDYRPFLKSNVNAVVKVKANRITAVFAEIWFGADYARAGGYGYALIPQCLEDTPR